jgi:hypothetical protein
MNSNTTLAIFAILAATALLGATVVTVIPVDAQNGVPFEKNFGQCKKDKNENACRNNK